MRHCLACGVSGVPAVCPAGAWRRVGYRAFAECACLCVAVWVSARLCGCVCVSVCLDLPQEYAFPCVSGSGSLSGVCASLWGSGGLCPGV